MQFGGQAMAQALGKELVSMMGQELIQKLGAEMGLPQSAIDAAQAAFCSEIGDTTGAKRNHREAGNTGFLNSLSKGEVRDSKQFLEVILNGFDASPAQRGNAERAFDGVQTMIEGLLRDIMEEGKNSSKDKKSAGRSWIAAMAETLGKVLDKAWGEVETKIDRITEVSNKGKEDRGKLMPSATAEFQGAMAEFNMIMQAVTTAIKTAGEASASMTRKQ